MNCYDVDVDEVWYMQVIYYKIVKFFEVVVQFGVIFGGVIFEVEQVMVIYGMYFGIVF